MPKNKKKNRIRINRKIKRTSTYDKVQYSLDQEFEFFPELRSLILKSSPAEKYILVKKISALGRIKLAVISGIFMNSNNSIDTTESEVDLFLVGDDIDKAKLRKFLKALEAEVGKELRFGLMEKEEFEYRYGMFDRFVRVLLESPHDKLINKLGL